MLDNLENRSTDLITPQITIEPIDLDRRMYAYDGSPEDWYALVKVPMGRSLWDFSLAEINRQDFRQLELILGSENFQTIVSTQGYVHPNHQFAGYQGEQNLYLYYYTRETQHPETRELILVSFGESQPGRYIAHIEGFWEVTGVDF
jgi:hypothetical protein